MDLLQGFKDFIQTENLSVPGEKWLLAVSGGIDSVVLCELCHRAGLDFVIAHANFQLRGEESSRDEAFVHSLAAKYDKPLLVKKFDTAAFAASHKLSIQVAARELRYTWFREILAQKQLSRIATAHHLDDNIETLLMNFFKGTGIAGLRAILPSQDLLIRPLLFARKDALKAFAETNSLSWVEDSSNTTDKYTRNYFRHQVIPLIQQVFPEAIPNLADNIPRFREIETIYRAGIDLHKRLLLEHRGNEIFIPVLKLKKVSPLHTILYEIIKDFGFSPQQVPAVTALFDSPSGRFVRSSSHRILKDRAWFIISPLESPGDAHVIIESPESTVVYDLSQLRCKLLPASQKDWQGPANTALLDASAIRFPLLLRKWRTGDYFYPLGMKKKKKLSRFFIDNKLSLAAKEKIWVLEMDKKILWVVGMRIDDRFRVGPQTTSILRIETGML